MNNGRVDKLDREAAGSAPAPLVAIYTIRTDEFKAVLARMGNATERVGDSGQRYMQSEVPTARGGMRIALFRGVDQANPEAQVLVKRAIDDLNPDWVMVVGIAGGVPHTDFTIGDVIVATEVLDFMYEAKTERKEPDLHPHTLRLHRSAHPVVAMLPAFEREADWNTEATIGRQHPAPC